MMSAKLKRFLKGCLACAAALLPSWALAQPKDLNEIARMPIKGRFALEQYRNGKLIAVHKIDNLVTNTAVNLLWDVFFNSGTQIGTSSWFMGLVSSTSYSAIVAADTMASHAGWTEATGYTSATRPAWGQGAAASRQITNASPVSFIANGTATIKGLFITSNSTKGGTTGTLWSAGLFSTGDASVVNLDELRVTYTLGA